jgi:hypothetical protein
VCFKYLTYTKTVILRLRLALLRAAAEGPAKRIVPVEISPLFANTLALLRSDYMSMGKGLASYSPALAFDTHIFLISGY